LLAQAGYSTFADFGAHVAFIDDKKNLIFNALNQYTEAREEFRHNMSIFNQWIEQNLGPDFDV
jgi:hypothetical protein